MDRRCREFGVDYPGADIVIIENFSSESECVEECFTRNEETGQSKCVVVTLVATVPSNKVCHLKDEIREKKLVAAYEDNYMVSFKMECLKNPSQSGKYSVYRV